MQFQQARLLPRQGRLLPRHGRLLPRQGRGFGRGPHLPFAGAGHERLGTGQAPALRHCCGALVAGEGTEHQTPDMQGASQALPRPAQRQLRRFQLHSRCIPQP